MDLRERADEGGLRHPWETARARHFQRVLGRSAGPLRVLDVGAGDGWFAGRLLGQLPPGSVVTCWDTGYDEASRKALPDGVVGTAAEPEGRFELMLFLDVLEHVEEDVVFLRRIVRDHLARNGVVLVSVPAWPVLYNGHDRALGHNRRYTPSAGRRLVRGAGLRIRREGGLFPSLIPIRALQRGGGETERPPPLRWSRGALSAAVVEGVLRFDSSLCRWAARCRVSVPGLTWWAVCEGSP